MRSMSTHDGYDNFRKLIEELVRLDLFREAEDLQSALVSGSTASECLGLAGQALSSLRKNHPSLAEKPLASFIATCVQDVRVAWKEFK
jgi:hypothetical protein